ncbi:MAG TPA: PAS domain S-box protein, partial [Candidatus Bathyarchaeia archaeon]|nr:PAS domain S-box protein [Candidatus Bathyarchaeia archaeon]
MALKRNQTTHQRKRRITQNAIDRMKKNRRGKNRLLARQNLEETTARLAAIVNSSEDAIIGKTLDGIITSWNTAAERLYGYSVNEVLGRPVSILIPAGKRDDVKRMLEQVREGVNVRHYETQRQRKDGTVIDVSLSVSPVKDSTGRIMGAATIARDISQQKRMQENVLSERKRLRQLVDQKTGELAESVARLTLITDSLPALISYVDPELRYKFVNKSYEEWFGRAPAEIVGRHVKDVLGEMIYQRALAHLNLALSGERQSYDYALPHRSLGTRYVRAMYIPDIGPNGKARGVFVLAVDVTDRKLAENASRESERRYRELFQASPVPLWEVDFSEVKRYFDEFRVRGIKDLRGYLTEHPEDLDKCGRMAK